MGYLHVFAFFTSCVALGIAQEIICPGGWVQHAGHCYLFGNEFYNMKFYTAVGFCSGFKNSYLAEPNNQAEYDFFEREARNRTWLGGPWIGMIRHVDGHWMLMHSGNKGDEPRFYQNIDKYAAEAVGMAKCGGMDMFGRRFGFWTCGQNGSPVCEMEPQETVSAVSEQFNRQRAN